MHGDGTRPAITRVNVAAVRLLDLTRSLRRAGHMPTGVDRVERAYLEYLLQDDVPLFGLVRTALGYLLLDQKGARNFLDRLNQDQDWPIPDILSRLRRNRDNMLARAETALRRDAIARCLPIALPRMLARQLSGRFDYFNVGHSNLTDRVLQAVKAADGQIHVLIHDVIPLEHPEYQRPGTVAVFRDKLQRVSQLADRVIYNSADTAQRAETQMQHWKRVPPSCIAHLGIITPRPEPENIPKDLLPSRPFFMTVGTIEPRKNHAFLLDLWDQMGPDAPPLLICGNRGWNNEAVFQQLDELQPDGSVRELSDLNDATIAALIQRSAGVLFPTHAEGFGLPAAEALALGARVLCNDLDIFREILNDWPDFASISDSQTWLGLLKTWEDTPSSAGEAECFVGPNWSDHFNTVLGLK